MLKPCCVKIHTASGKRCIVGHPQLWLAGMDKAYRHLLSPTISCRAGWLTCTQIGLASRRGVQTESTMLGDWGEGAELLVLETLKVRPEGEMVMLDRVGDEMC